MSRTYTAKEWRALNTGLAQHKKLDALETELAWNRERGKKDPELEEYVALTKQDLFRPAASADGEIQRLKKIMRKHELERRLKIEVSFDMRRSK